MKTLLRLCCAAALATVITACGDVPTGAKAEIAPARRDGVTIGGGHRTADSDSATINTVNGDLTTDGTTCLNERGVTIGGGHLIGTSSCE